MTWFDTESGEETNPPKGLVTTKRRKRSLTDLVPWLILAGFGIVALIILVPLLESGGPSPTTNTGYVGSLEMDPTMVGAMETQVAGQQTQIAQASTHTVLLQGIQPTATATPKSTATRNPTPQMPDCVVANVGDRCRFPALRPTPDTEPTATTIPCSVATPDIYSQICIKDR